MAISLLGGKQYLVAWLGSTSALADQSWRTNVSAVFGRNLTDNGWLSYKPTNQFNSLPQITNGRLYLFDVKNDFTLSGSDVTLTVMQATAAKGYQATYTETAPESA